MQTNISLGDYDPIRPLRESLYLTYPQAGYGNHPVQPSPMTYDRQADQMPFSASSFQEPRADYEMTQPTSEASKLPEVTGFDPERGPHGSHIYVYISTTYDLAYAPLTINLMFASRLCTPIVDRLEPRGSEYHYQLTVEVPPHATTGWAASIVPLSLEVQQNSKPGAESVDVGTFYYTDAVPSQSSASPHDGSRKRKISLESADSRVPTKKTSSQRLQSSSTGYAGSPYGSQYSYQQQPSSSNYVYGIPRAYGHERQDGYLRRSTQSGSDRSVYSTSTAPSQASAWSSPYVGQSAKSPALTGCTSRYTSLSSASSALNPAPGAANPPLIRTSTLQPPSSPAGSGATSSSSMYPYGYKAVLKINGDLDSMAESWSDEEWTVKRRLVQFRRSQNNNTIETEFQAVPPEQGAPKGGICISCIWWAERQECYVTSVDTIYLLEQLVAVRFKVDEKNRIRRNLEGFRPTTVSKGKSDSEDFFKVIMDFPNPKPRNIEKDVKVFPWKILSHALKKIIGKYVSASTTRTQSYGTDQAQSATYDSTASSILTPRNSTYAGLSDSAGERRRTTSPRSTSTSTSSSAYAGSLMSTTLSPSMSQARASEAVYSEAPVYPVTAPSLTYSYSVPTTQSQYASAEHLYPSAGHLPSSSLGMRGSWDLSPFIETSPTVPAHAYKAEIMSPTTTHTGTRDVR